MSKGTGVQYVQLSNAQWKVLTEEIEKLEEAEIKKPAY